MSRTEMPRNTKIGTEVTCDSDTTFKVKGHRERGHIVAASRTACYEFGVTSLLVMAHWFRGDELTWQIFSNTHIA